MKKNKCISLIVTIIPFLLASCNLASSSSQSESTTSESKTSSSDVTLTTTDSTTQSTSKSTTQTTNTSGSSDTATTTSSQQPEYDNLQELAFYPLNDGTYGVAIGHAVFLDEITIPATYKGRPVSTILEGGFSYTGCFKKIVLPTSISHIGQRAFYNVDNRAITFEYKGDKSSFLEIEFEEQWLPYHPDTTFIFDDGSQSLDSFFNRLSVLLNQEEANIDEDNQFYRYDMYCTVEVSYCCDLFGIYISPLSQLSFSNDNAHFLQGNEYRPYNSIVYDAIGKTEVTVTCKELTTVFTLDIIDSIELTVTEAVALMQDAEPEVFTDDVYSVTGIISGGPYNHMDSSDIGFYLTDFYDTIWVSYVYDVDGNIPSLSLGANLKVHGHLLKANPNVVMGPRSILEAVYSDFTIPEELTNKHIIVGQAPSNVSVVIWEWPTGGAGHWVDMSNVDGVLGADLTCPNYLFVVFPGSGTTAANASWSNPITFKTQDLAFNGTQTIYTFTQLANMVSNS